MTAVVGLCVALPLLASALVLGVRRLATLRDVVTVSTMAAVTGMAAALLAEVERSGTVVLRVGDWAPDLGIVLVADLFAALILLVASATILVVELFAIGQRRHACRRRPRGREPDPAGARRRCQPRHPHRRPLHAVRRVRADPRCQLRAAHPSGARVAGAIGHDVRGDQPVRVDAVPVRRGDRVLGHRHRQHGVARRAVPAVAGRDPGRHRARGS